MKLAAVTGHTSGLGKRIKDYLEHHDYKVHGYSKSTGHDLRDYSIVTDVLDQVRSFDLFVNCAKPDYVQSQVLYRLMKSDFKGTILNIGSPVVHHMPPWTDLGLLEYVTQKTALFHAHQTLSKMYAGKMIMWEPQHVDCQEYVNQALEEFKF